MVTGAKYQMQWIKVFQERNLKVTSLLSLVNRLAIDLSHGHLQIQEGRGKNDKNPGDP